MSNYKNKRLRSTGKEIIWHGKEGLADYIEGLRQIIEPTKREIWELEMDLKYPPANYEEDRLNYMIWELLENAKISRSHDII